MTPITRAADSDGSGAPESLVAPPFTALDVEGRHVALADFRGRQNVVLVFNRGFR